MYYVAYEHHTTKITEVYRNQEAKILVKMLLYNIQSPNGIRCTYCSILLRDNLYKDLYFTSHHMKITAHNSSLLVRNTFAE